MFITSFYSFREQQPLPQPHECLKNSMKVIETVVSIALFIIGFLAIISSAYPASFAYSLAWIAAGWTFVNIASFVIPFLCRQKQTESYLKRTTNLLDFDDCSSNLKSPILQPSPTFPDSKSKEEDPFSPTTVGTFPAPVPLPNHPPRERQRPHSEPSSRAHSPDQAEEAERDRAGAPIRRLHSRSLNFIMNPASSPDLRMSQPAAIPLSPPDENVDFYPSPSLRDQMPIVLTAPRSAFIPIPLTLASQQSNPPPQSQQQRVSPPGSRPLSPSAYQREWVTPSGTLNYYMAENGTYILLSNPPSGANSQNASPRNSQTFLPHCLVSPSYVNNPTIQEPKSKDIEKKTLRVIEEAKSIIYSFERLDALMKDSLIRDFDQIPSEEGTEQEKLIQAQRMLAALDYHIGENIYRFSEFTIKGIPNWSGSNCHLIAVLLALAHNRKFDYPLWRPFTRSDHEALEYPDTFEFESTEKQEPQKGEEKGEVWDVKGPTYEVTLSLIKKLRELVDKIRKGEDLLPEDVPHLKHGDARWLLEPLGIESTSITAEMFARNFLNMHDWPVLLLDSGKHITVVIKKSDSEWFWVDDHKVTPIKPDYTSFENNRKQWQPIFLS